MSQVIDMTGKKYGRLTVLKRGENTKGGQARWICQCDCGKIITVAGNSLRRGATKSCGCYQRERTSEACKIDLVGQIIGNFTVLEYCRKPEGSKKNQKSKWKCRCNLCGNEEVYISGVNLNKQYSCGCSISSHGERKIEEILNKYNIPFIKEKRFSDLTFKDTGYLARFDFFVNNSYIIEFDGRQHFIQGEGYFDNKDRFERTQEHDKIKNEYCKQHNIPLIRIPFTEINNLNIDMLKPETSIYLLD